MLLGYGARNCWCFKDWLDVDLRLNGYVPQEISGGLDYATIMGFKGANASGKTNALKILAFITDFARNSFLYSPESRILFDSYFSNSESSNFYIEFKTSKEYCYEAVLTVNQVVEETLSEITPGGNKILIKRSFNEITENCLYNGETKIIYRNNASLISTLHQYAVPQIEDVYSFFEKTTLNVTYTGLRYEIARNIPSASKFYFENEKALQFIKELIRKFDTGISDIKISFREDSQYGKIYFPVFYHENLGTLTPLGIEQESTGTKALYIDLLYYYISLNNGGILILDEFDINLHPDILPHLLNLFIDSESNPSHAQMIFTSHNSEIMDELGKYRTYLFEKEDGESIGYRLDEPKTNILRNDRSISVPYRKHLIGGYPKIEAR